MTGARAPTLAAHQRQGQPSRIISLQRKTSAVQHPQLLPLLVARWATGLADHSSHLTEACARAGQLQRQAGATLNFFASRHLEHMVGSISVPEMSLGTPGQAHSHRKLREMKGTLPGPSHPYLSSLTSTRLTEGDSVMWACTLCWPETRDTSLSESCPAPVRSSCLV